MLLSWMEIVVLLYALFLSFFHLMCDRLSTCISGSHEMLLSYGGGSLLAIIFLVFLPEAVHFTPTLTVYPLILLGFVLFLLSEKYLYQHVKDPDVLDEELYYLHVAGFFIDHFIKGFILVTIILLEPMLGFLAAIPFFIHTLSSSIALRQLDEYSGRYIDRVLLSSSTVIGTLVGLLFKTNPFIERNVVAFISGMMLFLVSRDILPKKKEGRPLFFILGVITVFILWLGLEYLSI